MSGLDKNTLGELRAEAIADQQQPAPGATARTGDASSSPAPAPNPADAHAETIAVGLKLARDFGAETRFPSLAREVTDELIVGFAVPAGKVCAKYGIDPGQWLIKYADELALGFGAFGLLRAVNRALKADVAARQADPKKDTTPAPPAGSRGDGTLAPQ